MKVKITLDNDVGCLVEWSRELELTIAMRTGLKTWVIESKLLNGQVISDRGTSWSLHK